jgi:L-lactate utilization protein LutB
VTPKQKYNALLAQKIIAELQRRNLEGYYCETKNDAFKKVLELIPKAKDAVVSCGGSATLNEIGLIDALRNGEYNFLDPNGVKGAKEMDDIAHQALSADYFLMSTNAITEKGELVNADGYGNRVSALIFGPKNVIVVAGLNKVEPNLDAAILRVKKTAARMIVLKFSKNAPAFDEVDKAAEGAISQLVITSMSTVKDRIKVVLVGESLGF